MFVLNRRCGPELPSLKFQAIKQSSMKFEDLKQNYELCKTVFNSIKSLVQTILYLDFIFSSENIYGIK